MAQSTLRASTDQEEHVEPLFFRHESLLLDEPTRAQRLRPIEVCEAAARVVASKAIYGAQRIRGLWRIYLRTKEARAKLYPRGIDLRGQHVQLYDKNPEITKSMDPSEMFEKIYIRDLPMSVDNSLIMDWLETHPHLKLKGQIEYARERNSLGKLTDYVNGDRYIWAKGPIFPILPYKAKFAGMTARIMHDTQFQTCKACRNMGHTFKSEQCPAYDENVAAEVFKGPDHPYSNFYETENKIIYKNCMFDTAEHAFQWAKAMHFNKPEVAAMIITAAHGGKAKFIANKYLPEDGTDPVWDSICEEIMREIVEAKFEASPIAKAALMESGTITIAEGTGDLRWACGLWKDIAQVTRPRFWPGENKLGEIIMALRRDYQHAEEMRQTEAFNQYDNATNGEAEAETEDIPKNVKNWDEIDSDDERAIVELEKRDKEEKELNEAFWKAEDEKMKQMNQMQAAHSVSTSDDPASHVLPEDSSFDSESELDEATSASPTGMFTAALATLATKAGLRKTSTPKKQKKKRNTTSPKFSTPKAEIPELSPLPGRQESPMSVDQKVDEITCSSSEKPP